MTSTHQISTQYTGRKVKREINKIAWHTCGSAGMQSLTHACLANLPHATALPLLLQNPGSYGPFDPEAVKLKYTDARPHTHINPAVR